VVKAQEASRAALLASEIIALEDEPFGLRRDLLALLLRLAWARRLGLPKPYAFSQIGESVSGVIGSSKLPGEPNGMVEDEIKL
jgi:hypothetical protein